MRSLEERAILRKADAGRSVPEWIGASPDTPIPPRVKLRVFERYGGVCYLSGIKIRPGDAWDAEHVIALCNGGENRESNLRPALRDKHREKTAADVALKSKTNRIKAKHLGIWKPKSRLSNPNLRKKMNGEVVSR